MGLKIPFQPRYGTLGSISPKDLRDVKPRHPESAVLNRNGGLLSRRAAWWLADGFASSNSTCPARQSGLQGAQCCVRCPPAGGDQHAHAIHSEDPFPGLHTGSLFEAIASLKF